MVMKLPSMRRILHERPVEMPSRPISIAFVEPRPATPFLAGLIVSAISPRHHYGTSRG
ncbi:MAG: hypothetical protein JWO65_1457 [Sphingomonas bacterium]|nr:hypothetical protein [Sphingomonas bacterium]